MTPISTLRERIARDVEGFYIKHGTDFGPCADYVIATLARLRALDLAAVRHLAAERVNSKQPDYSMHVLENVAIEIESIPLGRALEPAGIAANHALRACGDQLTLSTLQLAIIADALSGARSIVGGTIFHYTEDAYQNTLQAVYEIMNEHRIKVAAGDQ